MKGNLWCRFNWHTWRYSIGGGFRHCEVCRRRQVWDWMTDGEWRDEGQEPSR